MVHNEILVTKYDIKVFYGDQNGLTEIGLVFCVEKGLCGGVWKHRVGSMCDALILFVIVY